jgi:hypothetical protein
LRFDAGYLQHFFVRLDRAFDVICAVLYESDIVQNVLTLVFCQPLFAQQALQNTQRRRKVLSLDGFLRYRDPVVNFLAHGLGLLGLLRRTFLFGGL